MSEGGSPGEVNQKSRTPPPSSGQEIPAITSIFSTPGGSSTGPLLLDFSPYHTPAPSLSGAPSPHARVTNTPERVDLTLEGVSRNFLQLRHLLNQHVSQEREKGIRIRLDYEESEPSLSLGQPPFPSFNSRPSTSLFEAGPSVTSQPFNHSPCTYGRPSPTYFPLFTSQPFGHETTLNQIWQLPASSVPPTVTTWEQTMSVLPLARSASMSTPIGTSQTAATPESLQGFNLMPQMMAQMMAHVPWNQLINQALDARQGATSLNPIIRPDAELAKPYKPSSLSCFSQQIADYDFQTKIKMPPHIKTYDGTEDPEDHLQVFTGAARIEKWSHAECCLMFMQTLVGSARIWFNNLPAQSVRSFDDLSKGFLAHFSQQRRYVKDATVIFQISQKDDESLRDFIERYKKEGLQYVGA